MLHPFAFRSNDAFAANVRNPPFDDLRVRKAMQMALDLETVSKTYYNGNADPTPKGMIGAQGYSVPFEEWPEEVKKGYRYDPEGAEKLLDEAGYPRGADGTRFKTSLRVLGQGSYSQYAGIAVSYWAEIGVDVEINEFADWAQFHEDLFAGSYEGMMGSIGGAAYDPVMLVGWHRSDAQWNRPLHQWPELDAMVDAALGATTVEEQQRLARAVDMYAIEKHWQIAGASVPWSFAVQPWVIGYNGEITFLALGGEQDVVFARLWIDSELKEAMGR